MLGLKVGLVLLLACLWVLEKCVRLTFGRKNRGGLMAPNTLRVVAFVFLILSTVGLFTGYYRKMRPVAIIQAIMYCPAFFWISGSGSKSGGNQGLRQTKRRVSYGLPTCHASSCSTLSMHNPCGGTVGPDFERSRNANNFSMSSGCNRPRPTSNKVPTIFRTI